MEGDPEECSWGEEERGGSEVEDDWEESSRTEEGGCEGEGNCTHEMHVQLAALLSDGKHVAD